MATHNDKLIDYRSLWVNVLVESSQYSLTKPCESSEVSLSILKTILKNTFKLRDNKFIFDLILRLSVLR